METVFIDRAGQPIPEQRRLIRSIEHLKRVLRRPGITLERLDFNGYRASPPRTIQAVHSRYIVFEDGAGGLHSLGKTGVQNRHCRGIPATVITATNYN
jgi:hypothetical protein